MRKFKRIGLNPESDWRAFDLWKEADVPNLPGVYFVRCVGSNGQPILTDFTPNPAWDSVTAGRMTSYAYTHMELLYIGKAADLRQRFWEKLVQSWTLSKPLHPSRVNWSKRPNVRNKCANGFMQGKFIITGRTGMNKSTLDVDQFATDLKAVQDTGNVKAHVDFLKNNKAKLVQFFGKAMNWSQTDARKTSQPTPAAVMVEESSLLMNYLMAFGRLPPLNVKGPDRPVLTQKWLNEYVLWDKSVVPLLHQPLKPEDYNQLRSRIKSYFRNVPQI